MAEYTEITDTRLQQRVRARYEREAGALGALGFRPLATCLEALGPYSAITNFPVLLLAFRREVIVFLRPLRLAVGNALLFHTDPATIALCMGMGVKLYTALPDGRLLISSDFETQARPRPQSGIVRQSPFPSIETAWEAHRRHVAMASSGRQSASGTPTFRQYVDMSVREEDLSQYH